MSYIEISCWNDYGEGIVTKYLDEDHEEDMELMGFSLDFALDIWGIYVE